MKKADEKFDASKRQTDSMARTEQRSVPSDGENQQLIYAAWNLNRTSSNGAKRPSFYIKAHILWNKH